ncbi:MAG: zinc ribbon domain-containing protein [Anaerolineae bacterium]
MSENRFCEECGSPLNPAAQFCGQCGHPVPGRLPQPAAPIPPGPRAPAPAQSPPSAAPIPPASRAPAFYPPAPPPAPVAAAYAPVAEPVIGIIPALEHSKGFMRTENFTLVVTPIRLVFALLTQAMMNDAIIEARDTAKAAGKGFFGQMGAQLAYLGLIGERYRRMPIDAILAEQPGNFYILINQINKTQVRNGDFENRTPDSLVIESGQGKYSFIMKGGISTRDARKLLQQVLGKRAK